MTGVDRQARSLRLDVARDRVERAPAWDPLAVMADDLAEERLRAHFARS